MKRMSWTLSLLVLASLVLAACAGNANNGAQGNATVPAGQPTDAVGIEQPTATVAAEQPVEQPTATVAAEQPTAYPVGGDTGTTEQLVAMENPYFLSRLADRDVQGSDGESLGEIERLMIDETGAIRYVELKTNEILGAGGKTILLPWAALTPMYVDADVISEDELVLNIPADALVNAPEFAFDENMDLTAADWDRDHMAYWAGQNLNVPATGAEGSGQVFVVNGDLEDLNVVNTQGEDMGEVEDFIIQPQQGQILYGVVEVGGFLGLGERQVPVPFANLNVNQNGNIVLDIDQENLNNAPFVEDWNTIDFRAPDFSQEWDAFWANVTAPVQ